jgi:hypothetical protein
MFKRLVLFVFIMAIALFLPSTASMADVTSDVAANVPLSVIIKNALGSGMSAEEAVAAIIKAGANPVAVVYTAITEGLPASKVIASAIRAGAPLDDVIRGAIGAGASHEIVSRAAVGAGAEPSLVADTIARQSTLQSEGLGYSPPVLPATVTLPAVTGGAGGDMKIIGGGKAASPYKPK